MAATSLAALLVMQSKATIYGTGIRIARSIGLPVSTWQPGDPSRAQFWTLAELFSASEENIVGFIAAGFLETAAKIGGIWVEICAKQFFNVDVPPATFAKTKIVLTNNGGGFYDDIGIGDLTFRNPETGKTYRNTSGGTLASGVGQTLTLDIEAEEAGSASSSGAGEISEFVNGYLEVTVSNPTAAIGTDKQPPATTVQQCLDKIDSWSPNGPKGAYSFVARDPKRAGTNAISRVRVYSESDTGRVTVYLAGPSGGVPEADRALVEAAILKWATPLCITPLVYSATNVTVPVSYKVWAYRSINRTAAELESDIAVALGKMFSERAIGGDVVAPADGILARSLIESAIRATHEKIFRVDVLSPSSDVALERGEVAVSATPTAETHLVEDP